MGLTLKNFYFGESSNFEAFRKSISHFLKVDEAMSIMWLSTFTHILDNIDISTTILRDAVLMVKDIPTTQLQDYDDTLFDVKGASLIII